MKLKRFNKLFLASAVSVALSSAAVADTNDEMDMDEGELNLTAIKLTNLDNQLLANAVFTETYTDENNESVSESFVEAALMSPAEQLPVECDITSAFPSAEGSNDNPAASLVGDWNSDMPLELFVYVDGDDEDGEDGEGGNDDDPDSEVGHDIDDAPWDEDVEGGDDDDGEDGDDDDGEDGDGDDDGEDGDGDDDWDDDDWDGEDGDSEDQGEYKDFLSVSASGYMVVSQYQVNDGVASCNVTYVGELVNDVYKPSTGE